MMKFSMNNCYKMVIIIILPILITACNIIRTLNAEKEPQVSTSTDVDKVSYIQESAIIYSTLTELVNQSDVIVIGEAINKRGIVNTARDPDNHAIPDPEYYRIGQIYKIEIESYLIGGGPSLTYIIQNEGFIPLGSSSPTEAEIKIAKEQSSSAPLIIGRRYIMFLSYHDPEYSYDEFPIDDFLFASGHPWRFEITDADCMQPEDGLPEVYNYFPAVPLNEFLQYINNPATFPEVAYPAPLSPERCPVVSIDTTPYP
jgi:hypothetical protein